MEGYVRRSLIQQGKLTERGTSRRARLRTCRKCGKRVISGLDGDVGAFDVDADPKALTPEQEQVAWDEGRRTYGLTTMGRVELNRRWKALPPEAGRKHVIVVAEHPCSTRP